MECKLIKNTVAIFLSIITVLTLFSACSSKKDKIEDSKPVNTDVLEWIVNPNIKADSIEPLVRADYNENTGHYDVVYSEFFKIRVDGQYGIIDLSGKMFLPAAYDKVFAIRNGDDFIAIKNTENGKEQLYVHSDTFMNESAYKSYNTVKYEYYWNVDTNQPQLVKNSSGKFTDMEFKSKLPETVKGVRKTSSGYIPSGAYGLYANGKEITSMAYSGAGCFTNGIAAFKSNNLWGYIDSSGKTVIPFNYDAIKGYSALDSEDTPFESYEGYVTVCKNNKYAILKSDGTKVTDLVYDGATPVVNGKAFAKINGNWGVVCVDEEAANETTVPIKTTTSTTTTTTTVATTTTSTTTTTAKTTQEGTLGSYIIDLEQDDHLNLRVDSRPDADIICQIKGGVVLYIDRISYGWGHTVYNGYEGWINLKYTKKY